MFFVYILKSNKDGTFYIGSTKSIENRLLDHNLRSIDKYTCKKRPWKVVYIDKYESLSEALKEEKRLKKCKNKKYLEWLIDKTRVHSSTG